MSIANYDFEKILKGLAYVAVVVGAMGLIIKITRKLFSEGIKETLVGMLAIVGLSFILGYLADNLNKFADMDWGKIGKSLALSVAAIAVFGLVVFGIGTIVANPFVALFLAVGAVAVISLSFLLGVIADSLKKFNDVDGLQLIIVGEGLKYLGIGLVSFLGGMISGAIAGAIALITEFFGIDIPAQIKKFEAIDGGKLIYVGEGVRLLGEGLVPFLKGMVSGVGGSVVGKLASFFGLDPVSEIKEFEKIDADKISVLGLGLKNMGDGLRMLSSGIDLSGITAQIISLILPLVLCTKALDGFNRSLNRNMPSAELTQVYKMKVDTENSIQNAILETNKQELAIQQEQLMELQKSNELLKYIADNISSGSASKGGNQIINQNKPAESVTTSNFTTKNNYMNHMKLTSMSMG
jgi:hypothetical protein